MNRDKFVDSYLEGLLKDEDIKPYLERAGSDREKKMLTENLKGSLERSYDTYASEYFDTRGLGSYWTTLTSRGGSAGADAWGTYAFWVLGGAGFGIKTASALTKTGADTIELKHYIQHAKGTFTEKAWDVVKIIGEGTLERILAYLPIPSTETLDLIRGRQKFDGKVVGRAKKYAKQNFLDYAKRVEEAEPIRIQEKEPYMIPLEELADPNYASASLRKPQREFKPDESLALAP